MALLPPIGKELAIRMIASMGDSFISRIKRGVMRAFGEEEITLRPTHWQPTDAEPTAFTLKSKSQQTYKVSLNKNRKEVVIRRVDYLNTLLGISPMYSFKGAIDDTSGGPVLRGCLTMGLVYKSFLLIWFGGVILSVALSVFLAMSAALDFSISARDELETHLSTAGFLVGTSMLLLVFGALLLVFVRFLFRRQRKDMAIFLGELSTGNVVLRQPDPIK